MTRSSGDWLWQHRDDVERRAAEVLSDVPSPCWRPLLEAVVLPDPDKRSNATVAWARQQAENGATSPSSLLSTVDALSDVLLSSLPPELDREPLLNRLVEVQAVLTRHFAAEAERLAEDKSQLETLYGIAQELSSSLDLRRAFQKGLEEVMKALGAEKGLVLMADEDGETLKPESEIEWDFASLESDLLPAEWRMGRAGDPLLAGDAQDVKLDPWAETLAGSEVESIIAAPMIVNGEFRGLFVVGSQRADAFDDDDRKLFMNVLSQITTAVGNAEVYRLISEQAQELGQMLRVQQEEGTKSQAILTSIADGVVVTDTAGMITLVNPVAERILGISQDEMLGDSFRSLFSAFGESGASEATQAMETLLESHVPEVTKAFRMKLDVENRVIHAHLAPVLTQRGDFLGVVTVLRDITKEVEADRAKSEFVSTVSHELRTPMTAIKGYTDLLHAGAAGKINAEQQRFLSIIKNNTERLTALINDLLDISRIETGRVRFEPKPLQIGEVIADVVNALAAPADEKDLQLTYEVVGGLPELMGDRNRLNQVLTNLISNAIRYTPEGGEIDIRAYLVEGAVRIDVSDTGIGIPQEELGRIFERFYRADHPLVQETRGTGLGLSIVKMFVEMHGGRIWVESVPNEGSTFTFILPVPQKEEKERKELPGLKARVRTVLVVDDDSDVAGLVQRQLENGGYRVSVLGRGRSVVPLAEEQQPDLIILDLILPDLNGLDVLRALNENPVTEDIPVIIHSIVPDDGSAWEEGIVDYLIKPVDAEELLESVEEALTWQGRVLIVEDDRDTVGMLSATMRQVGFTPLVAADGYEALATARKHRPDLILLDLRLPGMDGFEALTHLKRDAVTQTIPIVTISAHVSDVDKERKRLIALGASSFIPKPFSIGELLDEVEAALKPVSGPPQSS